MTDWVQKQMERIHQGETGRKGGPGSGHHGHAGRPGQRGGSAPSGGSARTKLSEPAQRTLTNLEKDEQKIDGSHTLAELIRQHGPLDTMFEVRQNGPVFEVHQTRDALLGYTGIARSRHGRMELAQGGGTGRDKRKDDPVGSLR